MVHHSSERYQHRIEQISFCANFLSIFIWYYSNSLLFSLKDQMGALLPGNVWSIIKNKDQVQIAAPHPSFSEFLVLSLKMVENYSDFLREGVAYDSRNDQPNQLRISTKGSIYIYCESRICVNSQQVCKSRSSFIFLSGISDVERIEIWKPVCILLFTPGISKRCISMQNLLFYAFS